MVVHILYLSIILIALWAVRLLAELSLAVSLVSQKVSLGRVEKGCWLLGTAGWSLGTSIGVSGSAVNTFQFLFHCSSEFSQGFWNGDGRASTGFP